MVDFLYGLGSSILLLILVYIIRKLNKPTFKGLRTATSSVGKSFPASQYYDNDRFDMGKFLRGAFNIFDLKLWAKSITFFIRYFIIIVIVAGAIFGYGWWKGRSEAPVEWQFDYESEFTLEVPKGVKALHKPKNSSNAYWIDSTGKKTVVKVKDIPELQKYLNPIGLEIVPIAVIGYGVGEGGVGFEGGVGVSLLRFYRVRIEPFLTQKGVYIGASYKITQNSGLGLGAGKGWTGDNRIMFYWRMEF